MALETGPSLFRDKNIVFNGGVDILSKFEIERRLADALYEINYASKILNGEVVGDTEYALTRLDEARKQIEVLTIILKNWAA